MPRTSLEWLFDVDACDLSDHELVELMIAARRWASRVQAVELAAVAELARRRFTEAAEAAGGSADGQAAVSAAVEVLSPADYVHDEVAEALTLTRASAGELIRFATELAGRLPATFAALSAGDIDYCKARALWHGTDRVDDGLAGTIEAMVLPKAPGQTTGEIRAKIRRLVRRLAPEALARRREEAEKRRGVELIPTDDGTAQLSGVDLPADAAGAAYRRVAAIAAGLKRDGDGRAIGQLRADVFLGLLRGTLSAGEPPADTTDRPTGTSGRIEPGWTSVDDAVADVIAEAARAELTTLTNALGDSHCDNRLLIARVGARIERSLTDVADGLGEPDHGSDDGAPTDQPPATATDDVGERRRDPRAGPHVDRPPTATADDLGERHHHIGTLIADAAARINRSLADLRGRWCVPGPQPGNGPEPGNDVRPWHGHAGYRPPAALRRLIEHRDRRCCFPGCRRPVRRCDADHTIPFHRGGPTCACNLAMLCRRHHRTKQTRGWRIEHLWPGVILWITPTGHWKITAPADRE